MAIYQKLALAAGSLTLAGLAFGLPARAETAEVEVVSEITEAVMPEAEAPAAAVEMVEVDVLEAELEADLETVVDEAAPAVVIDDATEVEETEAADVEASDVETTVEDMTGAEASTEAAEPAEATEAMTEDTEATEATEADPLDEVEAVETPATLEEAVDPSVEATPGS